VEQGLPLAEELSAVYARMSGLLLSHETVDSAMELVTSLARECLPGSAGAGVTLVDGQGRARSAHATDALVEQADALQYELGEGPCLTAWADRLVVRVDDVRIDPRWPRWSAAAGAAGLNASLSAPLVAGDAALGAIKVYAREAGSYDAWTEQLLTMFAGQAAVLLANVQSSDNARRISDELADALHGRDAVNRAMGILMARDGLDETAAFAALMQLAGRQHRKIRDVAVALVEAVAAAAR
jgi:GAF domain-containing protein